MLVADWSLYYFYSTFALTYFYAILMRKKQHLISAPCQTQLGMFQNALNMIR